MANRLSHSAINKYLTCGKAYEYHYIQKWRASEKSSALIFGSAIDLGLNALLLKNGDPVHVFNAHWENARVSGDATEYIPDHKDLRYAESDFDVDLLQPEDFDAVQAKSELMEMSEAVSGKDLVDIIVKEKKDRGYNKLKENEVKLFNFVNWLSLKRKAPVMIKAYEKEIMPRIKKVHSVQKQVSLANADGDSVIGYIDLIVDFTLDNGTVVKCIADNKTSSIEYAQDAVITSQQLAIYCLAENINYGAFFVIRKQLNKNKVKLCTKCGFDGIKENKKLTTAKTCDNVVSGSRCHGEWKEQIFPTAKIDVRIDEIKDYNKNLVVDTMDQVNKAIKAEIFPRNFQACNNFNGCEFKNLCHYNDPKGLKKEVK